MADPTIQARVTAAMQNEYRGITALSNVLHKIESTPNRITLADFREYEVLFRAPNADMDDDTERKLEQLGDAYLKLVDPYKPVEIIKSAIDKTVILTLPPIFASVRTLAATKENAELVATNYRMAGHDVPRYQAEAFGGVAKAILQEQTNNVAAIAQAKAVYDTCMVDFRAKYQHTNGTGTDVTTGCTTEWEFSDD